MIFISESVALHRIKNLINDGKRLIFFDNYNTEILHILRDRLKKSDFLDIEIWQNIEESEDYVLKSYMEDVLKIYRMYDFSDRILVISDSDQFGNMFNYVKNGLLSKEEMVEALLCKI